MSSVYQTQLVNSAFEEGHFEIAIQGLEQLRSPQYKPTLVHLLHLIFIALHPEKETAISTSPDTEPLDSTNALLQSPRKLVRASKTTIVLSSKAVNDARRLLLSLVLTCHPSALCIALPRYRTKDDSPPSLDADWGSTSIYNQSAAIVSGRSCWEIIKEGYTTVATRISFLASPKKSKRTRTKALGRDSSLVTLSGDSEELQDQGLVGAESWFLLEWLVRLFQRDADLTEEDGEPRHSPLLLQQLPLPPAGTVTRWDASEPLQVAFYSLQQTDPRKQRIGVDLLTLLIELSHTPFLAISSFINSVYAHLITCSASAEGGDPLSTFFDALPTKPHVLAFRASICTKFLGDTIENSSSTDQDMEATGTIRVKPQPKKSAPRPVARTSSLANAETAPAPAPKAAEVPPSSQPPKRRGPPISAYSDILRLLQIPSDTMTKHQSRKNSHIPPWVSPSLVVRMKYELALACGLLLVEKGREGKQTSTSPNGVEEDWLRAIRDGSLTRVLDNVFPSSDEDAVVYKTLLDATFSGASTFSA